MNHRPERVSSLIREELSKMILRDFEFGTPVRDRDLPASPGEARRAGGSSHTSSLRDRQRDSSSNGTILVTITDVDVDAKMNRAVVWVSVFPSEKAEHVVKVLNFASYGLTKTLLRKINIRPMPDLHFEIDHGPENAARVEKELLKDNNE